jgi:hypothetical protein
MTLSKLTLATTSIFIMGISLSACTATNSKPSDSSLTHDYAGCISVPGGEQEKTTTAIAQKAQRRKTSSSEKPDQDSAGCILVPDSK